VTKRNLLKNPYWEANDLGEAIPDSPHAVSVALPRWKDVIAYEEKDPDCFKLLKTIYPRFGLNPLVGEVANKALQMLGKSGISGWPYPNYPTAIEAKKYCERKVVNAKTIIKEIEGLQCLIADKRSTPAAKAFWQHTGLGASSRQAAIALKKEEAPKKDEGIIAKKILKNRLAKIYDCDPQLIQLHPSGMAALTTALNGLKQLRPKQKTLQLGFPYVDVLKLPQVIFDGGELLLSRDLKNLSQALDIQQPSAVIVELPSNPLMQCVDLKMVAKLAHERGILVIADDTIGSSINIDPIPFADLVFSSLTKSFAGRGDILAGSLLISPKSKWKDDLRKIIPINPISELSNSDAIELEKTSRDIKERIYKLNNSCLILKEYLEVHPEISKVLHPSKCSNFKSLMKSGAGYGCLLSFELRGGLDKAKKFYDALQVCKGPSLGTNFTLACPYVLLAHYQELEWADKCGVPASLLRVSVGLEEPKELQKRFEKAFLA